MAGSSVGLRTPLVVRLTGPALPVVVAVDAGVMVGYLPGPAMRRIADLHSCQAEIDVRAAVIIAEVVRKMPHTLRSIALDDEQVPELSMSCGFDDDLRAQSAAVSNRARDLPTQVHSAFERVLGPADLAPARACLLCLWVVVGDGVQLTRCAVLSVGKKSRQFRDHRQVIEAIVYRYWAGIPWRYLPCEQFGPWQAGRYGSGTAGSPGTGPGIGSSVCCWRRRMWPGIWTGRSRWSPRSTGPISTRRTREGPTTPRGARSNSKDLAGRPSGPAVHGVGRSRGGLSTKIHHAVDGRGRPIAVIVAPGQGHDGSMVADLLAETWVAHPGDGRSRTTKPGKVLGDKHS